MTCQGYLFSMSTIHCAIFAVTGFCRICQSSLSSQVSALGVHLDNFVSNAMPGLLLSMSTIHLATFRVTGFCMFANFHFQLGVDTCFTLRQFYLKRHTRATSCPCPPHCVTKVEWLASVGFANFLFSLLILQCLYQASQHQTSPNCSPSLFLGFLPRALLTLFNDF